MEEAAAAAMGEGRIGVRQKAERGKLEPRGIWVPKAKQGSAPLPTWLKEKDLALIFVGVDASVDPP